MKGWEKKCRILTNDVVVLLSYNVNEKIHKELFERQLNGKIWCSTASEVKSKSNTINGRKEKNWRRKTGT